MKKNLIPRIPPSGDGLRNIRRDDLTDEETGLLSDGSPIHRDYYSKAQQCATIKGNHHRTNSYPDNPQATTIANNGISPLGKGLNSTPRAEKQGQYSKVDAFTKIEPKKDNSKAPIHLIIIYSLVNTIMCVPCLYGYASVIFNNMAFQPHINALSKLVLFSSIVHQVSFTCLSTLPFAIGQVQDAGLIFLSQMANTMADRLTEEGATDEELVSTVIVILGVATSCLGIVLVLMGRFRMADLVSYLPLPVVGGYLAFIGYFCLEAGVSLCISKSIVTLPEWKYLLDPNLLLLAIPGIIGGLLIMAASRSSNSDTALPVSMVALPVAFFFVVFLIPGYNIERARNQGWMGETSPPVPVGDVFSMIHLNKVRWEVGIDCIPTWVGMVFVVAFSSCLDVAAIIMDMGEPLDINSELATVGASNVFAGLFCGFTGSYIFSSTIFTYRTGIRSRLMGIYLMIAEVAVFIMTANVLEITPLFFLGATLTFIGFDLMYEWIVEVRHKLLLSEYAILLATFASIHIVGIDGGILLGILFAALDYVVVTAKASALNRVLKRSHAVWNKKEWEFLEKQGYDEHNPKIVTFEVIGNVFFGSSLQLLTSITDDLNIVATEDDRKEMADAMVSPMHHFNSPTLSKIGGNSLLGQRSTTPDFLVLDLKQMQNLDASSARGCFYQLTKMCGKRGITIVASGCTPRVDWILRSHGVTYKDDKEEQIAKKSLLEDFSRSSMLEDPKIIMFETIYEALEFCESCIIVRMVSMGESSGLKRSLSASALFANNSPLHSRYTLSTVFTEYLGLEDSDILLFEKYENSVGTLHDELVLKSGETIFSTGDEPDAFYIILSGSIVVHRQEITKKLTMSKISYEKPELKTQQSNEHKIVTGAGALTHSMRKHSFADKTDELGEQKKYLQLGSVFGFVDFILGKKRSFGAVAKSDDTVVAKVHRKGLDGLKEESPELQRLVDKLLLQASIRELAANVTEM